MGVVRQLIAARVPPCAQVNAIAVDENVPWVADGRDDSASADCIDAALDRVDAVKSAESLVTASGLNPPIISATDRDYIDHEQALLRHVRLEILCRA